MSEQRQVELSVVVACRNEAGHLRAFVKSLVAQELDNIEWEAIIADGMSEDGSRDVLRELAALHPRLRVIANPGLIASTGLNAAIRESRGEVVLRMDAHTRYAPAYCRRCIEALRRTGAGNVGGPARTTASGTWGRAFAAAYHSRFSTGGGRFHDEHYEGWVDTVPYGCWRRTTLVELGGFDETLVRNQDDELNLRLLRAGRKIWQDPRIVSWYSPRQTLRALYRQYFQYGLWKVAVIGKHHRPGSWRHVVPVLMIVVGLLLAAGAAAGSTPCVLLACTMVGAYAAMNLAASIVAARRRGWDILPCLPPIFATYHLSYGFGFLTGLILSSFRLKWAYRNVPAFTRITR